MNQFVSSILTIKKRFLLREPTYTTLVGLDWLLPEEITQYLCSYLTLCDVMTLARVNKKINYQLGIESFWCARFIEDFGKSWPDTKSSIAGFRHKSLYINNYKHLALAHDKLKWAIENGYPQKVKRLISDRKIKLFEGELSYLTLLLDIDNGVEILNILFENGWNSKINIDSLLYKSAEKGNVKIFEELLKYGADINYKFKDEWTSLYIAACNNNLSINVIGGDGSTPLYVACQNGHSDMVQELITNKADQNICFGGHSPLYIACQNGFSKIVEILCNSFNSKAKVNGSSPNGSTPLYVAAQNGHSECVKKLLARGADYNINRSGNYSPLYVASQRGHINVVTALCEAGININIKTQLGTTALYTACESNNYEIVEYLLGRGADMEIAFENGYTPLFIACKKGYFRIMKLLCSKGAKKDISDNAGNKLYDMVSSLSIRQILEIFGGVHN